ncbi:hypothetical protein B0H14DRAFT_3132292 [Mycena olivaceomarginata]|nr:hypothetical protein B0H14DRAFT_3132292 [Mycena olivaceomarginata]
MSNNLQNAILAFGVAGVVLTAVMLLSIAYAAWNPVSRPYLNRVSFRLLVCALISNLTFAATFIPVFSGPSAGCSFMAFVGVSNLMFSACMFFCTALNLQLVIVHGVNGNMMEKYYYIGSVVFVAICNNHAVRRRPVRILQRRLLVQQPGPEVQFRWLVGSQSVWTCSCRPMWSTQLWSNISSSERPKPPIIAYRSIIIRIGLYPLLSCFLSFTGSVLDIWLAKTPASTELVCTPSHSEPLRFILWKAMEALARSLRIQLAGHSCTPYSPQGIRHSSAPSAPPHPWQNHALHQHQAICCNKLAVHEAVLEEQPGGRARAAGAWKQSTTWGGGLLVEQSSGVKTFEERSAVSQSDAGAAKGKPASVEQEQEPESGLSEAELEREEELDVEAQTRSRAEDIVQQI